MIKPLNILILYDPNCTYVKCIFDQLQSFLLYSRHKIFYVPASIDAKVKFNLDLNSFDVIIFHYSIRLCFGWLEPSFIQPLINFNGLKVAFIQDEYDYTEIERQWLERLKIKLVFTCVPDQYRELVYPSTRFPETTFIQVLTGYVPPSYQEFSQYAKPLRDRKYLIGYRGRVLPFWYGNLGYEKWYLAKQLRQRCDERGLLVDIEWEDSKKIFEKDWFKFLANCRATIATESGSNVFDEEGEIQKSIKQELATNPSISYEEVFAKYLVPYEGKIKMNQISPRVFETVAVKTALVLFEGEYSGIVKPDIHYVSLKKDFSNFEEVLKKINDIHYLEVMIERTYNDIILSGNYSYHKFVENVDQHIERKVTFQKNKIISVSPLDHFFNEKMELKEDITLGSLLSRQPLAVEVFLKLRDISVEKYKIACTQAEELIAAKTSSYYAFNLFLKSFYSTIKYRARRFFNNLCRLLGIKVSSNNLE